MNELIVCPGTLAPGYATYSPACLRNMFNGRRVSHILPYDSPQDDEKIAGLFIENRKRVSISGVQEKLSLTLEKNLLRLTNDREQGTYLLKPIPRDLTNVSQVPANEHLTMQIARQVYKIPVAANALIFFKNGSPAYLTKRFDVTKEGKRWGVEDFASLAGKSLPANGADYKYEFSYEEAGKLVRKFIPAWRVEIEKYFRLVVFNYLFSNGDAHLKNFSILESKRGDYQLSPAYDLINTRLHVGDTDFALNGGLFKKDDQSEARTKTGHPGRQDFMEFGNRIGILETRMETLLHPFLSRRREVAEMIGRSFLQEPLRRGYLLHYQTRLNALNR